MKAKHETHSIWIWPMARTAKKWERREHTMLTKANVI